MRILVVDDDPQTLRQVRNVLYEAGYIPLLASHPEEAVALTESNKPQLILLDAVLSGTDGLELMQDIPGYLGHTCDLPFCVRQKPDHRTGS